MHGFHQLVVGGQLVKRAFGKHRFEIGENQIVFGQVVGVHQRCKAVYIVGEPGPVIVKGGIPAHGVFKGYRQAAGDDPVDSYQIAASGEEPSTDSRSR